MTTLKSLILATGFTLAAFAAVPSIAQAGGENIRLRLDVPGLSLGFSDVENVRDRRDRRGFRSERVFRDHRNFRPRHRVCTPRKAVRKARRWGLNRAHIRRVTHRGPVVAGKFRGNRVVIGFGKARHCPIRFTRIRHR